MEYMNHVQLLAYTPRDRTAFDEQALNSCSPGYRSVFSSLDGHNTGLIRRFVIMALWSSHTVMLAKSPSAGATSAAVDKAHTPCQE